jgi:hypothetical protein
MLHVNIPDDIWLSRRNNSEDSVLGELSSSYCLLLCVSCFAYTLTVKIEAMCSSETSGFLRIVLSYNAVTVTVMRNSNPTQKVCIFMLVAVTTGL